MRPRLCLAGASPIVLALLVSATPLSCRSAPIEPAAPAATESGAGRVPAVHVIVEEDHRGRAKLGVGDYVELPHDTKFVWTIRFENGSYFDPAPASDAGIERYRASRTGIVRTLVSGVPKMCMHSDAACPLAQYAWAVTLQID